MKDQKLENVSVRCLACGQEFVTAANPWLRDALARAEKAERERDDWQNTARLLQENNADIVRGRAELEAGLARAERERDEERDEARAERDKARKEWQSCWEKVQRQAVNLTNLNTRVNQLGAREAEQRGEIAELREERDAARAYAGRLAELVIEMTGPLVVAELALDFYAKSDTWTGAVASPLSRAELDRGKRAREALKR